MAAEYKPKTEDLSSFDKFGEQLEIGDKTTIELYQSTDDDVTSVTRSEKLDFGNEGFLLHGVLSPGESQHYINQGEYIGFQPIPGVKKTYRNCDRIVVESEELAEVLWSRIRPHLEDTLTIGGDPHDVYVHGIAPLLKGDWHPHKLNPLFRLCRYFPGGHFAPHFDGHLTMSSEVRSLKTFMLYLNGDFEGGTTNFVDESQTLHMDEEGKYCAEEKNILCRIKPESGLAIIFNHHKLHEGGALRSGTKYILRTDIMYKRSSATPIDPKLEQALQMIQEAERLEGIGECMESMELYRKAFKFSPEVAEYFGS